MNTFHPSQVLFTLDTVPEQLRGFYSNVLSLEDRIQERYSEELAA